MKKFQFFYIGCIAVVVALIAVYRYTAPATPITYVPASTQTHQAGTVVKSTFRAAENKVASRETLQPKSNWDKRFYASSDYYAFVSGLAAKGLNGDGRAAYFISKAIALCAPLKNEYGQSENPAAAFEAKWADRSNAPKWLLERARSEFKSCVGMIERDPFAELPPRPNGYWSASYWQDQAYADGDPLAQSVHAGDTLSKTHFEQTVAQTR